MSNLIIGGSGFLGREVTKKLLERGESVTVFSRREVGQAKMKTELGTSPRLRFVLGDVRDKSKVQREVQAHKNIFLFAAMKRVDSCTENPLEAVKTNVDGCRNVLEAIDYAQDLKTLYYSSTDKAVNPTNLYGATKQVAEKMILDLGKQGRFKPIVARYGNVLGSTGSVVQIFKKSLLERNLVRITDPEMTRFWITLEDAADFVLNSKPGLNVPRLAAAKVTSIARAVAGVMGHTDYDSQVIGALPGEKLHEELEPGVSSDKAVQYNHDELCELVRPLL